MHLNIYQYLDQCKYCFKMMSCKVTSNTEIMLIELLNESKLVMVV